MKETIANYLQPFITPEIAQVFCPAANTFDFADIDRGKIICVAMPQKFQIERRYVNTFLKMLFYTHALRRFDKPAEERRATTCSSSGPTKRSASSPRARKA